MLLRFLSVNCSAFKSVEIIPFFKNHLVNKNKNYINFVL